MTEILFNAPLWLIIILGVLGIGLLVPSLRGGDVRLRTAAMAVFAVAFLLLGLKLFMPTDQKKVENETRRFAEAVGKSDWATVNAIMQNASLVRLDWQGPELARRTKGLCETYQLRALRINSIDSTVHEGVITVNLSITTTHQGGYVDTVLSNWQMDWQKRAEGWILTEIRPIRVGTATGDAIDPLLRIAQ